MDLLVAYDGDPAGNNMALYLAKQMQKNGPIYKGKNYDLLVISSPAISADWLESKYHYDSYVFLSKHAAESGVLSLTCHTTGNFSEALFGGNPRQVAVPYFSLQKEYMKKLSQNASKFSEFQIILEATHHGPTALSKPSIFIEIGTTEKQWTDVSLCSSIAELVSEVFANKLQTYPTAIAFGGTHYPEKFTDEVINGKYAIGTITPKHQLDFLDKELLQHILERNQNPKVALLEWDSLGKNKQKLVELLEQHQIEMIKL